MGKAPIVNEEILPARMRGLARDGRGFPAFYCAARDAAGQPNFRVLDPKRVMRCILGRRCGVCGEKISGPVTFIGGPMTVRNRLYIDPGMHRECAYYALMTCPFLSNPRVQLREKPVEGTYKIPGAVLPRPDRQALVTANYRARPTAEAGLVAMADARPIKVEWFGFGPDGKPVPL